MANYPSSSAGRAAGYPKLRSACDSCHQMKVRCSGEVPCSGCASSGNLCYYSVSNRLGRPKGTKNKRTTSVSNENAHNSPPKTVDAWTSSNPPQHQLPSQASQTRTTENVYTGAQFQDVMEHTFTGDILENIVAPNGNESFSSTNRNPWDTPTTHEYSEWNAAMDARAPRYRDLLNKDVYGTQCLNFGDIHPTPDSRSPTYSSLRRPSNSPNIPNHQPASNCSTTSTVSSLNEISPSTPGPSSCNCLQQHAILVCNLKTSELLSKSTGEEAATSIDSVLASVHEAQKLWRQLVECPNCTYNDDQEVLVLATMSIRAVIRNWQVLQAHYKSAARGSPYCDTPRTPQSPPGNLVPGEEQRLSIGNFEITGEERTLLIRCLLLNTLAKIKVTVSNLREMLDGKMKRILGSPSSSPAQSLTSEIDSMLAEQGHSSNNLYYVQQMLQGFTSSLQLLENGLRVRN